MWVRNTSLSWTSWSIWAQITSNAASCTPAYRHTDTHTDRHTTVISNHHLYTSVTKYFNITVRNTTYIKLEGCIVLNEQNTVFTRSGPLYAIGVSLGPPALSTQTTSRSLYSCFGTAHYVTDWLTDHATRSITIGGAHSEEAKFCYCLRLQQVFIGAVDSNTPCLPFLRKRPPDGDFFRLAACRSSCCQVTLSICYH